MDRRETIKALVVGTVSAGVLVEACKLEDKKPAVPKETQAANESDRMAEEIAFNKKLEEEKFFTEQELATVTVLADIIIPRDEVSGSASDAKVAGFIEFMVKDKPEFQTPMRGGLRWLDEGGPHPGGLRDPGAVRAARQGALVQRDQDREVHDSAAANADQLHERRVGRVGNGCDAEPLRPADGGARTRPAQLLGHQP